MLFDPRIARANAFRRRTPSHREGVDSLYLRDLCIFAMAAITSSSSFLSSALLKIMVLILLLANFCINTNGLLVPCKCTIFIEGDASMNRLDRTKRAQIISALVEGNSLRATSRMTGVSKVTILRLLEFLGTDFARALLSNSDGNFELAPPA